LTWAYTVTRDMQKLMCVPGIRSPEVYKFTTAEMTSFLRRDLVSSYTTLASLARAPYVSVYCARCMAHRSNSRVSIVARATGWVSEVGQLSWHMIARLARPRMVGTPLSTSTQRPVTATAIGQVRQVKTGRKAEKRIGSWIMNVLLLAHTGCSLPAHPPRPLRQRLLHDIHP